MVKASHYVRSENIQDAGFGHMKFTSDGITYVGHNSSLTEFPAEPDRAPF